MPKISIRPVTLRRIVETIDLSVKRGGIDDHILSTTLQTTQRRAHEILSELQRMKLLETDGTNYIPNKDTNEFINAFQEENWERIHTLLFNNYSFYRAFIDTINEKLCSTSFSKDVLQAILTNEPEHNFNCTAIDLLCDWSERLGALQRNRYTCRYYVADQSMDIDQFPSILQTTYEEFNVKPRAGMRQEYVEIARIRESLCEKQRMKREAFDRLLEKVLQKSCGKIELCGAPITTMAKKSPSSLKSMKRGTKDSILSPEYLCSSEAQGIEINGKEYHYIAIFERLKV